MIRYSWCIKNCDYEQTVVGDTKDRMQRKIDRKYIKQRRKAKRCK
jgi:hypothetical protein